MKIISLTPDFASELLDRNSNFRKIRPARVASYARDMEAGKWTLSESAICINSEGLMVNGQHRCHAVIASGVTIRVLFAEGVEDSPGMDRGANRSLKEHLINQGFPASALLPAILRYSYRLQHVTKGEVPTQDEYLTYLSENPGILDWIPTIEHYKSHILIEPSTVGALAYRFGLLDESASLLWLKDFVEGSGLVDGDPVLALRRTIINHKFKGVRLSKIHRAALCVLSWNARRKGLDRKVLRWSATKNGRRPFPEIV